MDAREFAREFKKVNNGGPDSPEALRKRNIEAGRKNLRIFCNLRKPDFYKKGNIRISCVIRSRKPMRKNC